MIPLAPATLAVLAREHGGDVDDTCASREVRALASAWDEADAHTLVPVLRPAAIATALVSPACLLVDAALASRVPAGRRWVHPHPAFVLAGLLGAPPLPADERHLAHVEASVLVPASARVGAYAVVRAGAVIGEGAILEPHAVVYGGVVLGARVHVGAGAVLGRPGFGWATGPGGAVRRMPQPGGVVIEDDVEIGPHATIDAGTLGPTRIGRGAKLDAHVHVGHNVVIGPGCLVAAQAGFAGSARLGRAVLVGGQVGVADHAHIGDGARIAGGAGVIGDVSPGATVAGYPAVDRARWLRGIAAMLSPPSRARAKTRT